MPFPYLQLVVQFSLSVYALHTYLDVRQLKVKWLEVDLRERASSPFAKLRRDCPCFLAGSTKEEAATTAGRSSHRRPIQEGTSIQHR